MNVRAEDKFGDYLVIERVDSQRKDGTPYYCYHISLPGTGFSTNFAGEWYDRYNDDHKLLKENAFTEFTIQLEGIIYHKYWELDVIDYGATFDPDGKLEILCWFIDTNPEHYEDEPVEKYFTRYCFIEAASFEELDVKLRVAREDSQGGEYVPKMPRMQDEHDHKLKALIERGTPSPEQYEFWWLADMLAFGDAAERRYARKTLNKRYADFREDSSEDMFESINELDKKMAALRDRDAPSPFKPPKIDLMEEIRRSSKEGKTLLNRYIEDAIDRGIIKNASKLAADVGVDPAYLNNARSITKKNARKLSKTAALRIGIGLHLDPLNMTRFLASIGHVFPFDENDDIICELLEAHNFDVDYHAPYFTNDRSGSRYAGLE